MRTMPRVLIDKAAFLLPISILAIGFSDVANAQATLNIITPEPITLCGLAGQTIQPVPVFISASSDTIIFSVTSFASASNWMVVSPPSGPATTTPQGLIFVGVNGGKTSLLPGSYGGTITLSINGAPAATVSTQLLVGTSNCNSTGSGLLTASANPVSFNLPAGQTIASQSVAINNFSQAQTTISTVASTTDGHNWLSVSNPNALIAGGSFTNIFVSVNTAGLTAGVTYIGNIAISASNGASLNVTVTLVFSATGGNSTFSINPSPLFFNINFGVIQSSQVLQVTNRTGAAISASFSATTMTGQPWLSVSPPSQQIQPGATANSNVTVNTTGLSAGSYSGSIAITDNNNPAQSLNVAVTLNYGTSTGNSPLAADPNPLVINVPSGSVLPVNVNLTVSSVVTPVSFVATVTTASGLNWLAVNPFNSTVQPGQPQVLVVSVQPSLLSGATSTGTITLTPSNGIGVLQIPVTVNFGTTTTLTAAPTQFNFAYQTGTAFPPEQNLTLTSNLPASFSISVSTTTGGKWLVVSPLSGATAGSGGVPTSISVQVNPRGLTANTYFGQILITNITSNTQQAVMVTLLVSNLPVLSFANSDTTFSYQVSSGVIPPPQTVQVTSSGNPLAFTDTANSAAGPAFLIVTPSSGTTPQTLTLSLNPSVVTKLSPNTYNATATLTAAGAGNSPASYPVTLTVTSSPMLNPSQSSLSFNFQTGQAHPPAAQALSISSTGTPLTYAAAASTQSCTGFLSVTTSVTTTPGVIGVSVNPAGQPAGVCRGTVSVSSQGAGNSPLTIPVTLYISNSPLLNVSPSAISTTAHVGTNAPAETISLTSSDATKPINFTVAAATNVGAGWLTVTPTNGGTPGNLTIGFNSAGLATGTYTGTITITASGPANAPVTIPVTLVVASGAAASTTPTSLTFLQPFHGAIPAGQQLQVNSSAPGLTFSASAATLSGENWLSVTNVSGTTPGSIVVNANGSTLNQGVYTGVVTINIPGAANSPLNVTVTLIVGPAQLLTVSPSSLTFNYQQGSSTPASQAVQVGSTGANLAFTAVAATTGTPQNVAMNFFTVSPASGMTPATLTVGLKADVLAALSPGNYAGTVTLSSPNLANQTVTVSLNATPAPAPVVNVVANAASVQPGPVAPGEVVAIRGTNLGPSTGVSFTLTPQGTVPTTLSNVSVKFDGTGAPLLYVSDTQVNAIVPYEIAGRASTKLLVFVNGVQSAELQLQVADTSPAVFSTNETGNGQGAILNQDGTLNSAAHPAAKGSIVIIYATGEGRLNPARATGSVTPSQLPLPKPAANVELSIGGIPSVLAYAGEAPGVVSGVMQVNAKVPKTVGSGAQTLTLTVGDHTNSSQTITVAIQ